MLAPFRLVEYAYVDDKIGSTIRAAFFGFPDQSLYDAASEIPEHVVPDLLAMAAGDWTRLPAIYVYLYLERSASFSEVDTYLHALGSHLDIPLSGCFSEVSGGWGIINYGHAPVVSVDLAAETERFLPASVFAQRMADESGQLSYAFVTWQFQKYLVKFNDKIKRDDFIQWTKSICALGDLDVVDMVKPAVPCLDPGRRKPSEMILSPKEWAGGDAWAIIASGRSAENDDAARRYWAYVSSLLFADAPRRLPWALSLRQRLADHHKVCRTLL